MDTSLIGLVFDGYGEEVMQGLTGKTMKICFDENSMYLRE